MNRRHFGFEDVRWVELIQGHILWPVVVLASLNRRYPLTVVICTVRLVCSFELCSPEDCDVNRGNSHPVHLCLSRRITIRQLILCVLLQDGVLHFICSIHKVIPTLKYVARGTRRLYTCGAYQMFERPDLRGYSRFVSHVASLVRKDRDWRRPQFGGRSWGLSLVKKMRRHGTGISNDVWC
jgi:hypothetical protein